MRSAAVRTRLVAFLDRTLVRLVFSLARSEQPAGQGRATGFLRIFALVERLLAPWYRAYPVQPGSILSYELGRLPHGTRPLPLDPPVKAGDPIVRLHFNSATVTHLSAPELSRQQAAWEIARQTARDLTALAGMAETGAFPPDARAIWAETVIYRAMPRLGFQVREAKPSLRRPFARLYVFTLMAIYGPPNLVYRDLDKLQHYQLGEAWMDVDALLRRYAALNA